MKFASLYLLALSLLFQPRAEAQMVQDPTTWTYLVEKKGDGEYDLIFRVKLTNGWHIFSQNPGDEFLIPPSFKFEGKNFKLIGKLKEVGTLKTEEMEGLDNPVHYYEGTADFVQTIKGRAGTTIKGEHEYQVCNDRMCLPPKRKSFEFHLKD